MRVIGLSRLICVLSVASLAQFRKWEEWINVLLTIWQSFPRQLPNVFALRIGKSIGIGSDRLHARPCHRFKDEWSSSRERAPQSSHARRGRAVWFTAIRRSLLLALEIAS